MSNSYFETPERVALTMIAAMAGNFVFNGSQRPISHGDHIGHWEEIEKIAKAGLAARRTHGDVGASGPARPAMLSTIEHTDRDGQTWRAFVVADTVEKALVEAVVRNPYTVPGRFTIEVDPVIFPDPIA